MLNRWIRITVGSKSARAGRFPPPFISQPFIRNAGDWERLTSLVCIRRERRLPNKTQVETRFSIASQSPNADQLLPAIRDHWGIENSVHWVLDVAFSEDQSRVRKDHAPENLAVIRRIALDRLRKE
jgi:predicted transposase YbfD/YdcC